MPTSFSTQTTRRKRSTKVSCKPRVDGILDYITAQERNIRQSSYELDDGDDVSLDFWVESNKKIVFFHEEFSDMGPFLLGIQTEWQLQQMIQFGNGRLVALDSRFGTNKLKIYMKIDTSKLIKSAWSNSLRYFHRCGTVDAFDSFMEIFCRNGSWITTLKMMPIASLESSAALEFYHNQLKIRTNGARDDSKTYDNEPEFESWMGIVFAESAQNGVPCGRVEMVNSYTQMEIDLE
ncbi:hypothetical protein Tco_0121616 [Tanacetum coccineum]